MLGVALLSSGGWCARTWAKERQPGGPAQVAYWRAAGLVSSSGNVAYFTPPFFVPVAPRRARVHGLGGGGFT